MTYFAHGLAFLGKAANRSDGQDFNIIVEQNGLVIFGLTHCRHMKIQYHRKASYFFTIPLPNFSFFLPTTDQNLLIFDGLLGHPFWDCLIPVNPIPTLYQVYANPLPGIKKHSFGIGSK